MSKFAVAIAVNDPEYDDNQVFIVEAEDELFAVMNAAIQSYADEDEEVRNTVQEDLADDSIQEVEDVQEYMCNGGYSISSPVKIE